VIVAKSAKGSVSSIASASAAPLPGGRRERQKRKTQEKIVRAARALFERKGFEATTTQEIAERADIGAGTLFNYAKTKEDLLLMVFREEMRVVVQNAFATLPRKGSLLDKLVYYFECFVEYHRRDVGIAQALIRQLSSVNTPEQREKNREFVRELIGCIAAMVQDAQARGELRSDGPPLMLAHNLFAIYYRLLENWLGEYISLEQFSDRIRRGLELQLSGLRSGPAAFSSATASKPKISARR
jgi:AcrR family transcriptional regulator